MGKITNTPAKKKGTPRNPVPEVQITTRGHGKGNTSYTVSFNYAAVDLFPKREVVVEEDESGLVFRRPTMMDNSTKKLRHVSISYIASGSGVDLSGKYTLVPMPGDSEVFVAKPLSSVETTDNVGATGRDGTNIEIGQNAYRAGNDL